MISIEDARWVASLFFLFGVAVGIFAHAWLVDRDIRRRR